MWFKVYLDSDYDLIVNGDEHENDISKICADVSENHTPRVLGIKLIYDRNHPVTLVTLSQRDNRDSVTTVTA